MLQEFLVALRDQDQAKMESIGEAGFVNKLKESKAAQSSKDWFGFEPAKELDPELVRYVDLILVKGVGVDRSTNDDQIDYLKLTKMEAKGIRQYVHKYHQGMQDFYYLKRYEQEIKNLSDELWVRDNAELAKKLDKEVQNGYYKLRNEMT